MWLGCGKREERVGAVVIVDGGGAGKNDVLAVMRLCALSYTATRVVCSVCTLLAWNELLV
jgi:hypothetical protein